MLKPSVHLWHESPSASQLPHLLLIRRNKINGEIVCVGMMEGPACHLSMTHSQGIFPEGLSVNNTTVFQ